jgi:hypothetical protein
MGSEMKIFIIKDPFFNSTYLAIYVSLCVWSMFWPTSVNVSHIWAQIWTLGVKLDQKKITCNVFNKTKNEKNVPPYLSP